jgi:spore coat polysaccharide biosynthesis predicted glycosyltransferase SpsG
MASLLAECKMAICAPGSMVYELSYCAVPTLFLTVADNQKVSAQAHQKMGWCRVMDGLTSQNSVVAVELLIKLWNDKKQLLVMSNIAKNINDGQGVKRIIIKLEEIIS